MCSPRSERLGTRLRKLKPNTKKEKLGDGKGLGGKGRLTDDKIDSLQRYYGLAIRKNLKDENAMKKAVWATFYHTLSTDEKPQHEFCPKGIESWCGYNKSQELKTSFTHKNSLPEPVMLAIKPFLPRPNINQFAKALLT